MKRQAVISRFFTPTSQSSSPHASPAPKIAATVAWPPPSSSPFKSIPHSVVRNPQSVLKAHQSDRSVAPSQSLPFRKPRSSLKRKSADSAAESDRAQQSGKELGFGLAECEVEDGDRGVDCEDIDKEFEGSDREESDQEIAGFKRRKKGAQCANQSAEMMAFNHANLCVLERNSGGDEGLGFEDSADLHRPIPSSDPARHARFMNRLMTSTHEARNLEQAMYGSRQAPKLTPLEQQVVDLKAKYRDIVLMVEVGYKFRFFDDDAETAARVLGILAYYSHNSLTASIPTFRLHVHVRRLVEAGYKVGVVRQTETAAIKAHGLNKAGPFTRELSALYTRATLEAGEFLGGSEEGDYEGKGGCSSYLLCIVEQSLVQDSRSGKGKGKASSGSKGLQKGNLVKEGENADGSSFSDVEFGVVAVETSTGDVMHGQFKDTVTRVELEARLLSCAPAELLLASPLSAATEKLLLDYAGPSSNIRVERVRSDSFKSGGALAEVVTFYSGGNDTELNHQGPRMQANANVQDRLNEGVEIVMAMPELVLQALAHALRYLKQFHLENILRLGANFRPFAAHNEMILSPNALRQLEVLTNNSDGDEKGSLLWLMDQTSTSFGARLLRHWVTHPLRDHQLISARLDAVSEIADSLVSLGVSQSSGSFPGSGKGGGAVGANARGLVDCNLRNGQGLLASTLLSLGKMPDIERGITRIFHRTATTGEFVSVVQALVTAVKKLQRLQSRKQEADGMNNEPLGSTPDSIRSPLLKRLLAAAASHSVSEYGTRFLSSLNTEAATSGDKLNLFLCTKDRFPEVARCHEAISALDQEMADILPGFRKLLKIPNLHYMSSSGTTHLIEVPAAQRVPADWVKVNSTKKTTRYHPPNVLEVLDKLTLAKEELSAACSRAWDSFLAEFSLHYVDFRAAVQALAEIDCLHSLAVVSRNQGYCRPAFVEESQPPQLSIIGGRHPVLESLMQEGFVSNDTDLHGEAEHCQIITGPNMGGKSCYMRQVALIVIMAQVGSFVPATSAKLHVFDSIHTRMGASDGIQHGSSTFFEELSETSTILQSATPRSLVIIDELGRGTSTHDGVAIAYAALKYLLAEKKCLILFVTHYPKIAQLVQGFPGRIQAYHVSYLAEEPSKVGDMTTDELVSDGAVHKEHIKEAMKKITFLYKIVPGVASRSFGLHVARLAQIPEACVLRAAVMAAKLEKDISSREHMQLWLHKVNGGFLVNCGKVNGLDHDITPECSYNFNNWKGDSHDLVRCNGTNDLRQCRIQENDLVQKAASQKLAEMMVSIQRALELPTIESKLDSLKLIQQTISSNLSYL